MWEAVMFACAKVGNIWSAAYGPFSSSQLENGQCVVNTEDLNFVL